MKTEMDWKTSLLIQIYALYVLSIDNEVTMKII